MDLPISFVPEDPIFSFIEVIRDIDLSCYFPLTRSNRKPNIAYSDLLLVILFAVKKTGKNKDRASPQKRELAQKLFIRSKPIKKRLYSLAGI